MRHHSSIAGHSERERDERWLGGRLTPPWRDADAFARAARRIERLLSTRGLTSDPRMPVGLVGRARAGHTALVHHVLALNDLTHIGLYECLRIFGYDLEDLPRLQAVLHRDRTVLLPAATYDTRARVTWPIAFDEQAALGRGEFVSELVSRFDSRATIRVDSERRRDDGTKETRFLYLRVGRFETGLVPRLVPGTIVQVDTWDRGPARFTVRGSRRDVRSVYVVAHLRGLMCAYVDCLDDQRIVLVPSHHSHSPIVCRVDEEAIVLGRVCAEVRPMEVAADSVPRQGLDRGASRLVRPDPESQAFGAFVRASREAIGMTHRDAHAISVRVAEAYGDPRFAIGVGTLSDWESQKDPPLYVPHLISLATCYSVSFTELLRASGLLTSEHDASAHAGVAGLIEPGGHETFPPALLHAVRIAADLPDLSWDDVFRCGDASPVFDRALIGARYLIINSRNRRLAPKTPSGTIDRPLYVLSDECGCQIVSGGFADGGQLYVQPDPQLPLSVRALPRDRMTIRGRVVAALRRC